MANCRSKKEKKDAPKFKGQCQLCMGNVSAKPISWELVTHVNGYITKR